MIEVKKANKEVSADKEKLSTYVYVSAALLLKHSDEKLVRRLLSYAKRGLVTVWRMGIDLFRLELNPKFEQDKDVVNAHADLMAVYGDAGKDWEPFRDEIKKIESKNKEKMVQDMQGAEDDAVGAGNSDQGDESEHNDWEKHAKNLKALVPNEQKLNDYSIKLNNALNDAETKAAEPGFPPADSGSTMQYMPTPTPTYSQDMQDDDHRLEGDETKLE